MNPLRVAHVPFGYFPDPVGGTENYVKSLARQLAVLGVESLIAAPGPLKMEYEHEGQQVCRFPVDDSTATLEQLYGMGDPSAAAAFGQILDRKRPHTVHLHAFTRGASVLLVREAKARGIPVVFTYHTPTVSCQRGTLLQWGEKVCDGRLDVRRCSSCTLHGLGVGRVQSDLLGALPPAFGRLIGARPLSGGLWTALRMTELVELRHSAFRALMTEVDHVVVLRQWTKELLLRNNITADKITVCPHGAAQVTSPDDAAFKPAERTSEVMRVAYLGRLDRTKGVDILVSAVRAIPDVPLRLDVYGIAQGGSQAYLSQLKTFAGQDPRIGFLAPVLSERVVALLRGYDVLAVPSQCLETGPLVVLDAFAAGIPVVGSNLGGIAELVHHDVDGLLVDPSSIAAWAESLKTLAFDRGLLRRLGAGVKPGRGMDEVAKEMITVYNKVLTSPITRRQLDPAGITNSHC